jgi:2-hydroxychromene-2-carboxylate isomerase
MHAAHTLRFYFSLRSPYAWLASERLEHELEGLSFELELVPLFPTAETFPNDPVRVPNKLRYVLLDVMRLTKQYQLPPLLPGAALETDWAKAHAAFLGAQALGAGERFMRAQFRARFCAGRDVAHDDTLYELARAAEIDPDAVLRAAHAPALQSEVSANFRLGQQRDCIFGVPSFVFQGQLFWGHDRLSALRAAMSEASGGVLGA